MATSAKSKAAELKALQEANAAAIEFNSVKVELADGKKVGAKQLLTAMGKQTDKSLEAKEQRDAASMAFCLFAESVAEVNMTNDIPRDTVVLGFTKHLDALRPALHKDGCPFVEAKTEDGKPTVYSWKGYGNNVKSIAKGVVQFTGHDDYADFPEVSDCESFRAIRDAVEAARRGGESEDARLLREAKERWNEAVKALTKAVFASKDHELIDLRTLDVEAITEAVEDEAEQQQAIEDAAEQAKAEALEAAIAQASAEAEARQAEEPAEAAEAEAVAS